MVDWRAARADLDICIFGSFQKGNREILEGVITTLQEDHGYLGCRHVDLRDHDGEPILGDTDEEKAAIYEACTEEAYRSDIAVFLMFEGDMGTNHSALLELQARILLRPREAHARVTNENTILLHHESLSPKTMIEGMLLSGGVDRVPLQAWEDPDDLKTKVAGFLLRR